MSSQILKIWKIVGAIFLIALLLFIFLPNDLFSQPSPEKHAVIQLLSCTNGIKNFKNYRHECDNLIQHFTLHDNQIEFTTKDFRITLRYLFDDNGKAVKCIGMPQKYFPKDC